MLFIMRTLQSTVVHYRELYYENDYYRYKKLLDLAATQKTEPLKQKVQLH